MPKSKVTLRSVDAALVDALNEEDISPSLRSYAAYVVGRVVQEGIEMRNEMDATQSEQLAPLRELIRSSLERFGVTLSESTQNMMVRAVQFAPQASPGTQR